MSAAEYAPGTVAVATVRGVEGVRVMRIESNYAPHVKWVSAQGEKHRLHEPRDVTDVRPLVVLDIKYADGQWTDLIAYLRAVSWRVIADQIEAQTKPPRIPEPGFDGAVEACHVRDHAPHRRRFVRSYTNPNIGSHPWTDGDVLAQWSDLVDPTLIREGVGS